MQPYLHARPSASRDSAAAALAEPDDTGKPLDLSGLDARLDALDGT